MIASEDFIVLTSELTNMANHTEISIFGSHLDSDSKQKLWDFEMKQKYLELVEIDSMVAEA